jgi:hypothetical protein
MFEIVINGAPTGETDRHGRMIHVGDIVTDGTFVGPVVLANAAFRVDFDDGVYLRYNSSLLFQESGEKRFTVIKNRGER